MQLRNKRVLCLLFYTTVCEKGSHKERTYYNQSLSFLQPAEPENGSSLVVHSYSCFRLLLHFRIEYLNKKRATMRDNGGDVRLVFTFLHVDHGQAKQKETEESTINGNSMLSGK